MQKQRKGSLLVGSIIALGSLFIAVLFIMAAYVNFSNTEVTLRNQFTAQTENQKTIFDNAWKVPAQQAGVTSEYSKQFKDAYQSIIAGRYEGEKGNAVMKVVVEQNPQFDSSLFSKLMDTITEKRNEYTAAETRAIDIKREHDNLIGTFPGSLFLSGRPPLKLQVVRSDRTDTSFETGQDDNVSLFPTQAPSKKK